MNSDLQTIAAQTETKPETVQEAEAFAALADAQLEKITAKTAPDLNAATATNLERLLKAATAYSTTHDAEVQHARACVKIAAERVEGAWRTAVHNLTAGFAADFDAAADALTAESTRLGNPDPNLVAEQSWNPQYATLRDLITKLDALARIRDAYANLHGRAPFLVSDDYEKQSRLLALPDAATSSRIISSLGRTRGGARYWLTVTRLDGVTARWQTPEQQQAQTAPAGILRQHAALSAQQAQRERLTATHG